MIDNPHWTHLQGKRFDYWIKELGLRQSMVALPEMVWVDIETTGLEETNDVPLEIGIILTDRVGRVVKDGIASWRIYDKREYRWEYRIDNCSDFVRQMHNKSGLWEALRREFRDANDLETWNKMYPENVARNIIQWLDSQCKDVVYWNGEKKAPLSGSSPQFDRKFIESHLLVLGDWFHYRNGADVSCVRNLQRLHAPGLPEPEKRELHRPIEDLADSIKLYRHQLKTFLRIGEESRAIL